MVLEWRFAALCHTRKYSHRPEIRCSKKSNTMCAYRTDSTWNSASQLEERLEGKQVNQIVPANEDEAAARLYRQLNARKCSSYLGDPPNLVNGEADCYLNSRMFTL